jgi:ATPase family associated with various cellular activities (AAA)
MRGTVAEPSSPPSGLRSAAVADVALGLLATLVPDSPEPAPALRILRERHELVRAHGAAAALARCRAQPQPDDAALIGLAQALGLDDTELVATALAAVVETRPLVGVAIQHLQMPLGHQRPTLGLLAEACASLAPAGRNPVTGLAEGRAVASGLLELGEEDAPLAERSLRLPPPLVLALAGSAPSLGGVRFLDMAGPPLPASLAEGAARYAQLLARDQRSALILRTSAIADGLAVAAAIAAAGGHRALAWGAGKPPPRWLGPLCRLVGAVPVLQPELTPGERREVGWPPGLARGLIVVTGPDGSIEFPDAAAIQWRLPLPTPAEREALWQTVVADQALARRLAREHRQGPARIRAVAATAGLLAALDRRAAAPGAAELRRAARDSTAGLDALAHPVDADLDEGAFVVPPDLRVELDLLVARCRARDGLAGDLGPALRARYEPGVRALFTGPSGTGKTLAALWLANRLGLPLYRVDLAALTSKYIGETEKNLATLLARAEAGEVVLLFDEADALFGKRTEIRDSNDRFANAQTNYLLQRIETYEGIVLLTSNSRTRFDPAFARRIDMVLEFQLPGPAERRELWRAHLGSDHALDETMLNRLAALPDLAGGQIRGAVLTAAALARIAERAPGPADLARGLAAEYRKLGRSLPGELAAMMRIGAEGRP